MVKSVALARLISRLVAKQRIAFTTRRWVMGLELRRDKKHNLRSKWWYGRYMINGKRHFTNLGVEVKGKVPKNIRKKGDMAFECSRTLAAAKLKELIAEAHSHKAAEKHLQELYELKAGEALVQISISDIAHAKFLPPDRRGRSSNGSRAAGRGFVPVRKPGGTHRFPMLGRRHGLDGHARRRRQSGQPGIGVVEGRIPENGRAAIPSVQKG